MTKTPPPDLLKIPAEKMTDSELVSGLLIASMMKNAWTRTEKKVREEMKRRGDAKVRRGFVAEVVNLAFTSTRMKGKKPFATGGSFQGRPGEIIMPLKRK